MFDLKNLEGLLKLAYVHKVISAFGPPGETAITEILNSVRLVFQRVPAEAMTGPLTVLRGMNTSPASPLVAQWGVVERLTGYEEVGKRLARITSGNHMLVELLADGSIAFVELNHDIDLPAAANVAIVYRYEARSDRILAKEHDVYVPKISSVQASVFCNPTLDSLDSALKQYAGFAEDSACHLLGAAWEGGVDGPRLVLVNKPEKIMRRSLAQALSFMLRDVCVRPEQNADESKTVDIRVEWWGSGASALIEIKWLGRSTAQQRVDTGNPTYTEYTDARARSGAKQLADYMDRQVRNSNATTPRGYLVVFDARRRNVSGPQDALSEVDAMHYEKAAIAYDPDFAAIRPDFEPPVRFFLNPRRSHFKEAA